MADKLREWFKYKTERKDGYKEQGMKSLLKQVANKVSVYGDTAVCNLIDECMSNGWKGIIWDKLQSSSAYRNSGDRIGNRVKDVDGCFVWKKLWGASVTVLPGSPVRQEGQGTRQVPQGLLAP